jgi:type IV secretory pathway TrbL component
VFRFWISEGAAFIPLGFCAVVFSVCIRRFLSSYCPIF